MSRGNGMKYLIVNADDLGASPGITRGILEAQAMGILTSASLMVDTPWSAEAAALARKRPELSVGLHADLPEDADRAGPRSAEAARDSLQRQFDRFVVLMDRLPSHLDSHHNVHRQARLSEVFLELARESGLPLRGHSPARYFSKFYGQWGGVSHPEQVGVESILRMLECEIAQGVTELSCHPGYVDAQLATGYAVEREVELETLCDPRVRAALGTHGISLASFHDLARISALRPTG